MTIPHPYRYPAAFKSQLERLEPLSPGITDARPLSAPDPMFFEIESTGASEDELAVQSLRLGHLERLIADRRIDGETRYHAGPVVDADLDGPVEFDDLPPNVSYIEFGADPRLNLRAIKGGRIGGVYIREVTANGMPCVELTFVCEEPGWRTMDSCVFAAAVEVGARISIGTFPLATKIDLKRTAAYLNRDRVMPAEGALSYALNLTATFAASA